MCSNLVSHLQSTVFGENKNFNSLQSESTFMITFIFTRVQKPKCPIMCRLSAGPGPPRSGIVINKTVTSHHIFSKLSLEGENQSFNSLQSENTFVITLTFTRVQKPKCPIKLIIKAGIYGFRSSPGYESRDYSRQKCSPRCSRG